MAERDCFLCHPTGEWYDRPLVETDGALVVAGVGAPTVGYVLIAPRRHVVSMARLDDSQLSDVIGALEKVEAYLGVDVLTVFEHGGCQDDKATSACIAHAHWHVLPGRYQLELSYSGWTHRSTSLTDALLMAPEDGYLLAVENPQILLGRDPKQSQFLRRHIFARLGRPDEWDYAAFPQWGDVRATQALFDGQSDA